MYLQPAVHTSFQFQIWKRIENKTFEMAIGRHRKVRHGSESKNKFQRGSRHMNRRSKTIDKS
jgi:hypothetical protein